MYRTHLKSLEISCHGIPWLVGCLAGLYLTQFPLFLNLLLGLILDIAVVAVIKAFTRRRRPSMNVDDQFATFQAVDKFSFPSGRPPSACPASCWAATICLTWRLGPALAWR